MATLDITFRSTSLTRPTPVHIIWPNDVSPQLIGDNPFYSRPCKTLVLLHGYTAGHMEWPSCSPINLLALQYNLAVVCPDGQTGFYLDQEGSGNAWCSFLGEELPAYLRRNLGLFDRPENTWIGGESMGGFGALHTALAWPEVYSACLAFSSALIVHQVASMTDQGPDDGMADYDFYVRTFGDPQKVEESGNNPETLVRDLLAKKERLPRLFMACGTEDFLLAQNRAFRDFLNGQQVPVSYHESPGAHNFTFWNQWIEPAIRWALELP